MTFTFTSKLPVVPVRLAISDALADIYGNSMESPPHPIVLNALVDTGASITLIKDDLAARLRLESKDTRTIGCLSDYAKEYPLYDAGISILTNCEEKKEFFRVPNLQVVGAPLSTPGIEMLLGMDILENFEVIVNMRNKAITLTLLPEEE